MTKKRLIGIKTFAKKFKEEGINLIEKSSEEQLAKIIKESNKLYYNENPIFNDNEYDIIKNM